MRVHYREALGLRGWTGPSRHGPMPSDAHLSRFVVSDVAQQQSICVCVPWHLATPPPPRQTQRMCCARLVGNGVATPKSNRQPTVRRHQPPQKRENEKFATTRPLVHSGCWPLTMSSGHLVPRF